MDLPRRSQTVHCVTPASFSYPTLTSHSTILAFYSIFVNASLVYDSVIPLSSQQVTLNLPDPDALWAANSEFDWQAQKRTSMSALRPNVSFQVALCTLLSCDTVRGDIHETATVFGQYILLCGIAEAFSTAKKLPMNYSSTEAFRTSAMSAFRPRGIFIDCLKIWKSLWWFSVESHWDTTVYAMPQAESVFLLDRILVALSHGCLEDRSGGAQDGLAAAIEIFCGASKSGFYEVCLIVSDHNSVGLSNRPEGRAIWLASIQFMCS